MSESPLRVVHLVPRLFGMPGSGGGERYTSELLRALAQSSIVTTLVVPSLGKLSIVRDGQMRRLGRRELLSIARAADLLHVHQLNSPAFDIGVATARAARKPVALSDYGGGWKTPGRGLGRLRLRAVDGLAAISQASVLDLGWHSSRPVQRLHGGGEHVLRGTSGHDDGRLEPVDFLYVGRLVPHKGVHDLIAALPRGKSLRIAGGVADGPYLRDLRSSATGKDVDFVDGPTDAQLPDLYRSASHTVMPTTTTVNGRPVRRPELLGLVMLESFACLTPCIGSRLPGTAEVIEAARMPSFRPGDVRDLATRLEEAPPRGSAEHQALSDQADAAARRFTWGNAARRCERLYREVVGSRS